MLSLPARRSQQQHPRVTSTMRRLEDASRVHDRVEIEVAVLTILQAWFPEALQEQGTILLTSTYR